jgi:menaquinone-dependent protoporphyrinogen oxidase
MDESLRVLVCYASAAGSTRGIAERIADRIRTDLRGQRSTGSEALCLPAGPDLEPATFDALVLGSAVHNMAWLPAATTLLDRATGSAGPVWVFSVGSVEPRGPLTRMLAARERAMIERAFPPGFVPCDHRMFGGIVVMAGVPPWGRLFWRLMGGRPGDHRDWPAIEAWADGIATALVAGGAPPLAERRP